jgi:hypothetical protein
MRSTFIRRAGAAGESNAARRARLDRTVVFAAVVASVAFARPAAAIDLATAGAHGPGAPASARYAKSDAQSPGEIAPLHAASVRARTDAAAANAHADNRTSPSGVTLQNAAAILSVGNGYFFGADAIVNSTNTSYPSGTLGLEVWATTDFPDGESPIARIVLTGIVLDDLPAQGTINFPFDTGTLASVPTSGTFWISVGIVDLVADGYFDVVTFRQERFPLQKRSCSPSDTNLCVNGSRFSLQGSWRDFSGVQQPLHVADPGTSDSGLFWFYGSDNWELLVKVLNACGDNGNDHYWVFAAAATTLEYYLTVKDTSADAEKIYFNPLGMPSASITDTLAFTTCP